MHQPSITPLPDKGRYQVLDDFRVKYGNITIVVPAGFCFDGASVPWFGWVASYTPFHCRVVAAALVHDWLYVNHQVVRSVADQIFYDLLILNQAHPVKAKLMYRAVAIAGDQYYKHDGADLDQLMYLYTLCRLRHNFDLYRFPMGVINGQKAKTDRPAD